MPEYLANNAQTTLNGAITIGATSLIVASASGFPTAASFRIVIDSEILLVTAGAGTTTWTVTRGVEGSTAAAHSSGAVVAQVLTVAGLQAVLAGAMSNLLVNGGCDIWQRGAGPFTADLAYTADRWQMDEAGTDALSITREGTIKKANSLYSLAAAFTLGNGAGATVVRQRLVISDGHHGLLGETVSLRASVRASAASACRAYIRTDGTGGTTTSSGFHAGNSAFADLDVSSVAVPSDATYVEVGVSFAVSVTAYLDNVMLIPAISPSAYVPLHPADEWDRCLRYYEVHGGAQFAAPKNIGYATSSVVSGAAQYFNQRKGGVPTMTKSGTWLATNCGQPAAGTPTEFGYSLDVTSSASGRWVSEPNSADDLITAEFNPS